jgi:hypothetical protein
MHANLAHTRQRWKVEGAKLMGSIEFIKLNTGERTTIKHDGSIEKDQVEIPKIEWCDRCQSWKSFDFGRYDFVMGSAELWYCMECK